MTSFYFNSWDKKCKSPFGAIKSGEHVSFSFGASSSLVKEVFLVIRKENGREAERVPLNPNDSFIGSYTLDQGLGLYFYYFEICVLNEENSIYYGSKNGSGGEGCLYYNEEDVSTYQLTCYESEDAAPDWYRNGVVYQIFPDRFFNGNLNGEVSNPKMNSFIYGTTDDEPYYIKNKDGEIVRWDFYGGNLRGIIEKIPYLKSLGVTIIYLNPIFEAMSNHRYDTADFHNIDGILGDREQFIQLVDTLHENDIRIILDGVFSHVGRNSKYFNFDGSYGKNSGAYRNIDDPYFHWFMFEHYPNEYKSWWGIKDLPEVDKNNADYQEFIYGSDSSVINSWTSLGVDGWRLDVADELPDFFLRGIRNSLDKFPDRVLIGEVWEDASKKMSYGVRRQYILDDMLHGVMNYPFREMIINIVTKEKTSKEISDSMTTLQENYPQHVLDNNLNNIGTHDTERILTMLDFRYSLLEMAVGLLFMLPGIPTIYYGDEAGLGGGKDPDNRKFFPWDHINQEVYEIYKKWTSRRNKLDVLKTGNFYPCYGENIFGILRYNEEKYALFIINLSEEDINFDFNNLRFSRQPELLKSLLSELSDISSINIHFDKFFSN